MENSGKGGGTSVKTKGADYVGKAMTPAHSGSRTLEKAPCNRDAIKKEHTAKTLYFLRNFKVDHEEEFVKKHKGMTLPLREHRHSFRMSRRQMQCRSCLELYDDHNVCACTRPGPRTELTKQEKYRINSTKEG